MPRPPGSSHLISRPNNGHATTQQENSWEFELDPRASQELIKSATATGQLAWSALWIAADVVFTVATFFIDPTKGLLAASIAWSVGVGGGVLSSVPFSQRRCIIHWLKVAEATG